MALIIGSWIDFRWYVERWEHLLEITYALTPIYAEAKEVRIQIYAGRYVFHATLQRGESTLTEIMAFLKERQNARRITETRKSIFA